MAATDTGKVLIVDDEENVRRLVGHVLQRAGYEVHAAVDGDDALRQVRSAQPDLVLLDMMMPGTDGITVCREIQEIGALPPLVVFLTARSETGAVVTGLDSGAVDYVEKPFDTSELLARVRAVLRSKRTRDELAKAATLDGLTGLLNRRTLDARTVEAISLARRHGRPLSCLMLDVDHFKRVNDTYGHAAGDAVLREVARRVREVVRAEDILGRYGGEEFTALLPETEIEAAAVAAEKIRRAIEATPVQIRADGDGRSVAIAVQVSIGVAGLSEAMQVPEDLIAPADAALYRAKEQGRNQVVLAT